MVYPTGWVATYLYHARQATKIQRIGQNEFWCVGYSPVPYVQFPKAAWGNLWFAQATVFYPGDYNGAWPVNVIGWSYAYGPNEYDWIYTSAMWGAQYSDPYCW